MSAHGEHHSIRELWDLDPQVTFLNHGSFGACPRPILEEQARWRATIERQPVDFFERGIAGALSEARGAVAAFLSADPEGLAFVRNATTGVNTVLKGLGLAARDEVVLADHSYPAIGETVERACSAVGARAVWVPVPLPGTQMAGSIVDAISERTRLVVVDAVTSPTGIVVDVDAVIRACREREVAVLVDGAHAPAMVPVDLATSPPDFWTGNFHKWLCAPKGAGALWVAAQHRDRIRPLVTSQPWLRSFLDAFDWTGTDDPSAVLTVPAAIDLLAGFGWEDMRTRNHALVTEGRALVQAAIGGAVPVPDEAHGWMAVVALPEGIATTREAALALRDELYRSHRIEVPFQAWQGRCFIRLSAHLYNRIEDYEALAAVLPALIDQ